MSSAVCNPPPPTFFLDGGFGGIDRWLAQQAAAVEMEAAVKKDGQFDIWSSIQSSNKAAEADAAAAAPYVHPLVRRSASSLSQRSLEVCTENLGCETGCDGVLPGDDDLGDYSPGSAADEELIAVDHYVVKQEAGREGGEITEEAGHLAAPPPPPPLPEKRRKDVAAVNYHCSLSRRSPLRTFPPPLPSLSRRDGPCLSMRSHRRDGRLVVKAVGVPPQNYLHSRRQDGRLHLTLVETTFQQAYPEEPHMQRRRAEREAAVFDMAAETEETEEEEEEEEEGEVEVVDRGILVEVKVSSPPQPQSGVLKVQRSSVVINKFVGTAVGEQPAAGGAASPRSAPGNTTGMTTTTTTTATAVVAAAAAASSLVCTDERCSSRPQWAALRPPSPETSKLLFTSKRTMNRQELLHQVRWCSEHLRPLFILEPCCIATS